MPRTYVTLFLEHPVYISNSDLNYFQSEWPSIQQQATLREGQTYSCVPTHQSHYWRHLNRRDYFRFPLLLPDNFSQVKAKDYILHRVLLIKLCLLLY